MLDAGEGTEVGGGKEKRGDENVRAFFFFFFLFFSLAQFSESRRKKTRHASHLFRLFIWAHLVNGCCEGALPDRQTGDLALTAVCVFNAYKCGDVLPSR